MFHLTFHLSSSTSSIFFSFQDAAGGGLQCNPLAVAAAATLLAAAPSCGQQNAADSFVTFAKTLKNNAQMISLAQIFVQQPRNTVSLISLI